MKKRRIVVLLLVVVIISLVPLGCSGVAVPPTVTPLATPTSQSVVTQQTEIANNSLLTVTFLDVGQGDSILIQAPNGKTMLIDAGEAKNQRTVAEHLKGKGIQVIDVLVATHPHADHICGMAGIVKNFDIGSVYMPKVTTTTKTFEQLLTAIEGKGLAIKEAKTGVTISLDEALSVKILAPNASMYDDLNDYSAVIRLTYNKTSFLFMGDASSLSEIEMLKAKTNVGADVLKVGHHGSNTSSSPAFLSAVAPKIAVLSVGKGNSFGHPASITLQRLNDVGVTIYRTDVNGTVVVQSDGVKITVYAEKKSQLNPNGYGHGQIASLFVWSATNVIPMQNAA